MTSSAALQSLLYSALAEPIGLLLRTGDFTRARQKLYAARAATRDPALQILQFRASPFPQEGDLIIIKETIELEQKLAEEK